MPEPGRVALRLGIMLLFPINSFIYKNGNKHRANVADNLAIANRITLAVAFSLPRLL